MKALTLAERISETADLLTVALDQLLPRAEGPEARLTEAMRYAALGPGNRLRPFFALETAKMFDLEERPVLRAACALECVHAYSLVHNDLPCIDDDSMRQGRLTVHKAYDEATAVLVGDALQAIAFEIPLLLARASDAERHALAAFAQDLGLAYQIVDDLTMSDEAEDLLGRAAGGRRSSRQSFKGKANYVSLLGVSAARQRLGVLAAQTKAHLDPFGERATYLRDSVDFVLDHSN